MFVVQKFFNDFRDKDEAWERARDKWIAEGERSDGYNYRSEGEYERKHPRPSVKLKTRIRAFFVVLAALALLGLMGLFIHDQVTKPKPPEVAQSKNCQAFNKDDHVRIQYGDYASTTGRIIGGCEGSQPYQVKLDPDQKASVPGDGLAEQVDVSNRTIGVDSQNNLVVIEDKKE